MSAHAIPAEAHDNPGPQHAGPNTQAHRQVLNDLITMGADLARFLHGQAAVHTAQQAVPHPAPAPDVLIPLTLAFDRIARSVRRSILLARSLARPVPPAPDPAQAAAQARAAARRQVIRAVEDAIQRTSRTRDGVSSSQDGRSDGQDSAETLQAELRERLDAPDLDDDICLRPAADIINEIRRDLGLAALPGTHPWKRRTPDDIRQLCAQAAAPSRAPQHSAEPQGPDRRAAPPIPGPQPDRPAAIPRTQPGPIHPGSDSPEDPAKTIAMILRHPAPAHGQWQPPPPA